MTLMSLSTTERRTIAVILIAIGMCIPFVLPKGPFVAAVAGGLWALLAQCVARLWWASERLDPAEDGRAIWRRSHALLLLCGVVMIAGIMVAIRMELPDWIQVCGALACGVAGTIAMAANFRGSRVMHGEDRDQVTDELWWANTYRAGHWGCMITGAVGAIVTLALMLDLIELSGLTVALVLTLTAWLSASFAMLWLEWRLED